MPVLGYLGAIAIGAGLYLGVVGLGSRRTPVPLLDELRRQRPMTREDALDRPLPVRLWLPLRDALVKGGRRWLPAGRTHALRSRLDNAGLVTAVETYYAVKLLTVVAGLFLGLAVAVLAGMGWRLGSVLLVLIGGAVGYFAPEVWVLNLGQRRQQQVDRALPEALDLLALTVQAGLGLEQGIAEVAGEVAGPLGDELDRLLKEQQLGRSRRDALTALADRNRSEDLRRLVGALLHAERLGTPVSSTLQVQARELRRRRRARARERAGKAPVKLLFPLIFGIFPAMFVVILGPGIMQIARALF